MAYTSGGSLLVWGKNDILKNDLSIFSVDEPASIASIGNISQISSGIDHTVVLTKDGKLYSWGNNNYNQLGVNTSPDTSSNIPLEISNLMWPNIKLDIDDCSGTLESVLDIPVQIDYAGEVAAFQLKISYSSNDLEIGDDDITKGELIENNNNWNIISHVDGNYIKVVGYVNDTDNLTKLGEGELINIHIAVNEGVTNNTMSLLELESAKISDCEGNEISISLSNGSITILSKLKGDFDGNNIFELDDLTLYMIPIIIGKNSTPTNSQLFCADVDNSGNGSPSIDDIDVKDLILLVNMILQQ